MGSRPTGANRVPYGRYRVLMPVLRRLVVSYGVSTKAVAEVFGLRHKTLTARLGETEAFEELETRNLEAAQQALVELILNGTLERDEYIENLTPEWQNELDQLLEAAKTPENPEVAC